MEVFSLDKKKRFQPDWKERLRCVVKGESRNSHHAWIFPLVVLGPVLVWWHPWTNFQMCQHPFEKDHQYQEQTKLRILLIKILSHFRIYECYWPVNTADRRHKRSSDLETTNVEVTLANLNGRKLREFLEGIAKFRSSDDYLAPYQIWGPTLEGSESPCIPSFGKYVFFFDRRKKRVRFLLFEIIWSFFPQKTDRHLLVGREMKNRKNGHPSFPRLAKVQQSLRYQLKYPDRFELLLLVWAYIQLAPQYAKESESAFWIFLSETNEPKEYET